MSSYQAERPEDEPEEFDLISNQQTPDDEIEDNQ